MSNKLIEDLEDVRFAVSHGNYEYANLKLQKMIIEGKQSAQQSFAADAPKLSLACHKCGHWIGADGHIDAADDEGRVIVTRAWCAKHYAELSEARR